MKLPKIFLLGSVLLFGAISAVAIFKKEKKPAHPVVAAPQKVASQAPSPKIVPPAAALEGDLPEIDRIHQLFTKGTTKLPIVETITYSSKVSWLKGRPAWIADYAVFYATSRHFIARALNGKPDYFNQRVAEGSQFNVFRRDKNFQFYLVVDASLCKMGFYYVDLDTKERVLLKTYSIGLGKQGTLPAGQYTLGDKVAIYRSGDWGLFREKSVEMITVFGTRWIPFNEAKGLGIHGVPWEKLGQETLIEKRDLIGTYASDGSVLMDTQDLEELFSIVITKPTHVVVVQNFKDAHLPGMEVASPRRQN
jgi:hypothetical protein